MAIDATMVVVTELAAKPAIITTPTIWGRVEMATYIVVEPLHEALDWV